MANMKKDPLKEKYKAVLVWGAAGDVIGLPVECMNREQIKHYFGRIEKPEKPKNITDKNGNLLKKDQFGKLVSWPREFAKGEYSDDTIFTIAIAESIIEKKGLNLHHVAQKHLEEYEKRLLPDGKVKGGLGGTTRKAMQNLQVGYSPLESGIVGSPGNAPPMKMSPVGMYINATGKYREGLAFAEQIGMISHLDPRSVAAGIVQAYAVADLLRGTSRHDFLQEIKSVCGKYEKPLTEDFKLYEKGCLSSRIQWIFKNKDAHPDEAFEKLGVSGLVLESFPFSLFMFQKYWDRPEEGLVETINYGGDTDTNGAMFGALAGALHGLPLPKQWAREMPCLPYLEDLGEKLYEFRIKKY